MMKTSVVLVFCLVGIARDAISLTVTPSPPAPITEPLASEEPPTGTPEITPTPPTPTDVPPTGTTETTDTTPTPTPEETTTPDFTPATEDTTPVSTTSPPPFTPSTPRPKPNCTKAEIDAILGSWTLIKRCYDDWSRCSPVTDFFTGFLWLSCNDKCIELGRPGGVCISSPSVGCPCLLPDNKQCHCY